MDISLIIVNYKSRHKLATCLESIRQAPPVSLSYEIVVVDNDSGDELNSLVDNFPQVRLIISQKNLGMGGGNNLGVEAAKGEYIFILNPDTVISPGAIEILFRYLKDNPLVGIVGPKLLNSDNSLQYSCLRFPSFFMPIWRRTFLGRYFASHSADFQMREVDHDIIQEVDWLMGSALMFKKEFTLSDGSSWHPRFDQRYFMYFEDTDLCRETWSKGLSVVYNPQAVLIHDHARESAKYPWYQAIFRDPLARRHIISWLKYFTKWGFSRLSHRKD